MNPKSARALLGAAMISFVFGLLVMSPAGSLFLYATAALLAVAPTIFGVKGTRVAAAVVLVASLGLMAVTYPQYDAEMKAYRERAQAKSTNGSAPLPAQPQNDK